MSIANLNVHNQFRCICMYGYVCILPHGLRSKAEPYAIIQQVHFDTHWGFYCFYAVMSLIGNTGSAFSTTEKPSLLMSLVQLLLSLNYYWIGQGNLGTEASQLGSLLDDHDSWAKGTLECSCCCLLHCAVAKGQAAAQNWHMRCFIWLMAWENLCECQCTSFLNCSFFKRYKKHIPVINNWPQPHIGLTIHHQTKL